MIVIDNVLDLEHLAVNYLRWRYMHFWRQFQKRWCKVLRFMTPSDHAACDDCVAFKDLFREATDTCMWFNAVTLMWKLWISWRGMEPLDCTRVSGWQHEVWNCQGVQAHLDHIRSDRNLEEYLQTLSPLEPGNPIMIHVESWHNPNFIRNKLWSRFRRLVGWILVYCWFCLILQDLSLRMAWIRPSGAALETSGRWCQRLWAPTSGLGLRSRACGVTMWPFDYFWSIAGCHRIPPWSLRPFPERYKMLLICATVEGKHAQISYWSG